MTVAAVAHIDGISEATLYNWRNQAKSEVKPVHGAEKNSELWTAEARFAAIIETATLSDAGVAEYCRKKCIYPE